MPKKKEESRLTPVDKSADELMAMTTAELIAHVASLVEFNSQIRREIVSIQADADEKLQPLRMEQIQIAQWLEHAANMLKHKTQ